MWRSLACALLLLMPACGSDSVQAEGSTVPTTTTTIITTRPSTTLPSATVTSTATPTTVPGAIEIADMDAKAIAMPLGASFEHVVLTDGGVLAHGHTTEQETGELARPMIWFSDDMETWVETSVIDLYPGQEPWSVPTVTDVAVFGENLYAFLMGDDTTTATEPSMLVSNEGVTWRKQSLTAGPAMRMVAFTPESPPYPGASAATDAVVYGDHLFVTGWARTDQGTSAAMWSSADGELWDVTLLPNASFANEWGSRISVGQAGYLVTLGGPVHSGAGALYSPDGLTWSVVGAVAERAAGAVLQTPDRAMVMRFDILGSGKTDLIWTDDGENWDTTPPLPISDESIGSLGIGPSGNPLVYSSWNSATVWTFDQDWIEVLIPQLDRLIDATDDHYIGTADNNLLILDRSP